MEDTLKYYAISFLDLAPYLGREASCRDIVTTAPSLIDVSAHKIWGYTEEFVSLLPAADRTIILQIYPLRT